jgi:hypothetical protein
MKSVSGSCDRAAKPGEDYAHVEDATFVHEDLFTGRNGLAGDSPSVAR